MLHETFCEIPRCLQANAGTVPQFRPQPFPSTPLQFIIYRHSVSLSEP